ncbi:hemerythrin family protein [candidate division KSB1 bacterium]|nr:hemerythrin family protein [candidate division KSB1 bacterium]
MAFFQWDPSYSVNIRQLDSDHKKLIDLVNTLHEAMKAGKAKDVLMAIFTDLETYTKTHFANEERLLEQHRFPGLIQQQMEHRMFVQKVAEQKKVFEETHISTAMPIMNFLMEWLKKHILNSDKKYGAFLSQKGVK